MTPAIYLAGKAFDLKANPFGADVANLGLYRAIARYAPGDVLTFLAYNRIEPAEISNRLGLPADGPKRLEATAVLNADVMMRRGNLMRPTADLRDLLWFRRGHGDAAFSITGLVHTLAPPALRAYIADIITAPSQPWDALICTSPSVRAAIHDMWDGHADYLASRFGGGDSRPRPYPMTPVIPLGVELDAFEAATAAPDARGGVRRELGIAEDEVVVLWVGRLSYFEKAFPSPMFRAVEEARRRTGAKVRFLLAGWFPGGEDHRALYAEAARAHCPSVTVQFVDGNDRNLVSRVWTGADVFLSLVDNIQETFGITPVEAMAAALPCVVSDWDGYRYTVRHGVDGFRIPTLGGPSGHGWLIAQRHILGMDSYQGYVGTLSQHTAVDVGAAATAIATLIEKPELRRSMGAAGREAVRTRFDWPVVIARMAELWAEQAAVRARNRPWEMGAGGRIAVTPVRGDPYDLFAGFATDVLSDDTVIRLADGASAEDLRRLATVRVDQIARMFRANIGPELLTWLDGRGEVTVRQVLAAFPRETPDWTRLLIAWLAKMGLVRWRGREPVDDSPDVQIGQ